jgi:alpha-tubulin suppressor-like RCC1 family protein
MCVCAGSTLTCSAGHGDGTGRNMPTLVRDLTGVGGVACGSAHTLAVSSDGKTVWSFGGGDHGKLGHGDTSQVYRPRVIEALQGLYIRKVATGSAFSLALTSNGQVCYSMLSLLSLQIQKQTFVLMSMQPVKQPCSTSCVAYDFCILDYCVYL